MRLDQRVHGGVEGQTDFVDLHMATKRIGRETPCIYFEAPHPSIDTGVSYIYDPAPSNPHEHKGLRWCSVQL